MLYSRTLKAYTCITLQTKREAIENRAAAIHIEHFIKRLEKEKKLDLKVKTEKKIRETLDTSSYFVTLNLTL